MTSEATTERERNFIADSALTGSGTALRWLLPLIVWSVFAVPITSTLAQNSAQVFRVSMGWVAVIALTPLVSMLTRKIHRRRSKPLIVGLHLLGVALYASAVNIVEALACLTQNGLDIYLAIHPSAHLVLAPLTWGGTAFLSLSVDRYRDAHTLRIRKRELEVLLERKRHSAAVALARPRFFVEVLREVESRLDQPRQAQEVLYHLSFYLREVLQGSRFPSQPLSMELEAVDRFADLLETIRAKRIVIELDPHFVDAEIPSLQLLGFVEECARSDSIRTVRVSITTRGGSIQLDCPDLGVQRTIDLTEAAESVATTDLHGRQIDDLNPASPSPVATVFRLNRWDLWSITIMIAAGYGLVSNAAFLFLIGADIEQFQQLRPLTLRWAIVGFLLYPLVCFAASNPIESVRRTGQIAKIMSMMLLFAVTSSVTASMFFNRSPLSEWLLQVIMGTRTLLYVIVGGVAVAMVHALHYWQVRGEELRRSRRLEQELHQVILELLERRLHPHFLFNVLNTAVSIIESNPKEATELLRDIEALLLATIDLNEKVITLDREISLLEHYLRIEKRRYEKRLHYTLDLGDVSHLMVPRLILQPIVENAIRHGMESNEEGLKVDISASRDDSAIFLDIEDNGAGIRETIRMGVGLSTTVDRLRSFYGHDAGISVGQSRSGGTLVSLRIPLANEETGRTPT
jgi:LytS/YehU family sensor histidine kinase